MSYSRHEISLYLELKRLEQFERTDLKRYYQAIDENIDSDEELHGRNRKNRIDFNEKKNLV